jgi:type VI secretion system protein ImpM
LQPDVCGRQGMAGLLMVSVDTVGRYFPLTIAAVSVTTLAAALGGAESQPWFARAEAIALEVLADHATYEGFLDAIQSLTPVNASAASSPDARYEAREAPDLTAALLAMTGESAGSDGTLWWSEGGSGLRPMALSCSGLPEPDRAIAFFDGEWARRGWHAV